jgi:hypothetical protein
MTPPRQAVTIASMIDEHTRCLLLNIVERSIHANHLVTELETTFTVAGGPPKVLRSDNVPGVLVSQALQPLCEDLVLFRVSDVWDLCGRERLSDSGATQFRTSARGRDEVHRHLVSSMRMPTPRNHPDGLAALWPAHRLPGVLLRR